MLLSKAVPHTSEEIQNARARKEIGNPPGKKADPLGDQLNWEQLLSHCKDKSKLWIIARDSDYQTTYNGKVFLNSLLYQDLVRVKQPPIEVFCFDSIVEGIRNFVEMTGVSAKKLPTIEESKAIRRELDSLPPLDWLPSSMVFYARDIISDASTRGIFSGKIMFPVINQDSFLDMNSDSDKP